MLLRRKFLDLPVRHGEEEAGQVQAEYRQASAHGAARFQPPLKPLRRRSTLSSKAGELARTGNGVALRAMVETAAGSGAAPWESIKESPDYELHRLTERSPAAPRGAGENITALPWFLL